MPTPAVPTLTLGDQLVTLIDNAWTKTAKMAPDSVSRVFDVPVTPETLDTVLGRQVYVLPVGYRLETASRAKNKYLHRFLIIVIEKYPQDSSGLPDVAWADERVKFAFDLRGWLDYPASGALMTFGTPQRSVWTESFEEVEVYDPDLLSNFGLWWSTIEVIFGEVL